MTLTQKQAEQILATIERAMKGRIPNVEACCMIMVDIEGEEVRQWVEKYVEIVEFEEEGHIIFRVRQYARNFDVITSIIDKVMKENELSYAVIYQTEQVDYRKSVSEAK